MTFPITVGRTDLPAGRGSRRCRRMAERRPIGGVILRIAASGLTNTGGRGQPLGFPAIARTRQWPSIVGDSAAGRSLRGSVRIRAARTTRSPIRCPRRSRSLPRWLPAARPVKRPFAVSMRDGTGADPAFDGPARGEARLCCASSRARGAISDSPRARGPQDFSAGADAAH